MQGTGQLPVEKRAVVVKGGKAQVVLEQEQSERLARFLGLPVRAQPLVHIINGIDIIVAEHDDRGARSSGLDGLQRQGDCQRRSLVIGPAGLTVIVARGHCAGFEKRLRGCIGRSGGQCGAALTGGHVDIAPINSRVVTPALEDRLILGSQLEGLDRSR